MSSLHKIPLSLLFKIEPMTSLAISTASNIYFLATMHFELWKPFFEPFFLVHWRTTWPKNPSNPQLWIKIQKSGIQTLLKTAKLMELPKRPITSSFIKSQENYQKAMTKWFNLGTLSSLKPKRALKTSSSEKGSSNQATSWALRSWNNKPFKLGLQSLESESRC